MTERTPNRGKHTMWKCKCNCLNETECIVSSTHLLSGHTKSCGCYMKEQISKANSKHKLCENRLYNIFRNMKQRCYNPKTINYKNYGGKGITICEEWLDEKTGFINFYNWAIKNGYNENLTIDRIDVNGDYEPNNCQWITKSENSGKDKFFFKTLNECKVLWNLRKFFSLTQKEFADKLKISRDTVKRIEKRVKEDLANAK